MDDLFLKHFFDLKEFSLRKVFEGCQYGWEALGKLEAFLASLELGKMECEIPKSAVLIHPEKISIGKGTIIESGAFICGPCVIGENCELRCGSYLRGMVLIGDHCVIGHGTEIKSSILLNSVSAAHDNYIGNSILGNQVNLGAGVKLANLRLDHQCILIADELRKISTNLKKLGAIIGDGCQLGCNAVTNPGTVIGKGVFCPPCTSIRGHIPSHTKKVNYADRNCF